MCVNLEQMLHSNVSSMKPYFFVKPRYNQVLTHAIIFFQNLRPSLIKARENTSHTQHKLESVRKRLEAAEKIHSQKQNIIQELQTQVKMIPTDTDPRDCQKPVANTICS